MKMNEKPFPEEFLSRYEPLELLSHSQISETLLVKFRLNGENYIAKLYDGAFVKEGEDERSILSKLNHPGIPKLFDGIITNDTVCIIRNYAEGKTLRDFYTEPAGENSAFSIGIQLCEILTHLHTQAPPIIHRDIKPENIIIDSAGKITLIDFGIARRYKESAVKDTRYFVSDGFSSPEQYGSGQTLPQSDIFSLGKVLCWLLTGSVDIIETQGIKNRALAAVITKCAALSYKDRYKTADLVKSALIQARYRGKYIKNSAIAAAAIFIVLGSFISGRVSAPPVTEYIEVPVQTASVNIAGESVPAAAADAFEDVPAATADAFETDAPDSETDAPEAENQISTPLAAELLNAAEETVPVAAAPEADTVNFKDPFIETAVRYMLNLGEYEAITKQHLSGISAINIDSNRIFKDDNDYFSNINNPDYNISFPLAPITTLEDLSLMPGLEVVRIRYQGITNIEPLSDLVWLSTLDLTGNPISDFSCFKSLLRLSNIDISNTLINDLSPLYDLPNLDRLSLTGNQWYDAKQLSSLTGLTYLDVLGKAEAYKYLPQIQFRILKLNNTAIDSLEFISFTKESLQNLELDHTELKSLNGIEEFIFLESLRIQHCEVSDLKPLLSLKYLREVYLSDNMREYAEEIQDEAKFEILFS
jgi:serine/threonine protein kinase